MKTSIKEKALAKESQVEGSHVIQFSSISLFPEMFKAISDYGVVGRAVKANRIALDCINPRDFTQDRHRTVDDRPYGGGPGMLMKVEPLQQAIQAAKASYSGVSDSNVSDSNVLDSNVSDSNVLGTAKVIYLSPQGKKLDHALVKQLSQEQHLILLSGRYEGIDQRLIDTQVDMEISLGDFVLSGGELAAMVLIDSITRLLPEVLGHSDSAIEDSFEDGLLDHPHYTRPEVYQDLNVPPVLLSGDHQAIEKWRLQQRLGKTWLKRPDLLAKKNLTASEQSLLDEFKSVYKAN
jgi:tRNA (guanine37-N1)-methyltransferase